MSGDRFRSYRVGRLPVAGSCILTPTCYDTGGRNRVSSPPESRIICEALRKLFAVQHRILAAPMPTLGIKK